MLWTIASLFDPRRWSLWRASKPVVGLVLAVYVAALLAVFPVGAFDAGSAGRFVALGVAGTACSLICRRMERARRFLEAGAVPNLSATWTFAGVLCLDHLAAVSLVAVMYSVHWLTQRAVYAGKIHRYVFGACTVVLGVRIGQFGPNTVLVGAIFLAVNLVLVAAAIAASGNVRALRKMADPREQATEILTLVLGAMTARLVESHLVLVVLTVPLIIALQYLSLCRHIRQPSTFDRETGALTPRAWHALGTLRLAQAPEAIVFQVIVDPLPACSKVDCARILRGAVRPEDLIGLTPDGFSVLMVETTGMLLAEMLALQIRARFAAGGIGIHIGSATTPEHGRSVDLQDLAVAASAEVIVRASNVVV